MVSNRNLGGVTGGSNPYGTRKSFVPSVRDLERESGVKASRAHAPGGLGPTVLPAPSNPLKPKSAPRPPSAPSGGSGGVSSTYTGAVSAPMSAPMAAPVRPSFEDWMPDDDTYQDTIASGRRSLNDLLANLEAQKSNYQTDISTMLRNLGFRGATVGDAIEGGQWDDSDRLGAFGQSFQNMMNDYASRGMLRSSLFADAENDLRRGFDNQREDIATALTQFLSGLTRDRTSAEQQFAELQAQAAREAAARYAATFGVDVPRTSS